LHARINKEHNKFAERFLLFGLESCVSASTGGCRNILIVIYLNTQKYKFLSVAFYEFEIWFHKSCEYNLRVLKNRILRTVCQPKRDKNCNVRVKVALRHVRVTTVAVEKQKVLHILCVCVSVALVIQHAVRMRCIIFSSVACPATQNISALSHKWHDFRGNVIEHKMCLLIFFTIMSKIFPIVRIIQPDTIIKAHMSSCKASVIPVRF
jgi:hypothetical protein